MKQQHLSVTVFSQSHANVVMTIYKPFSSIRKNDKKNENEK